MDDRTKKWDYASKQGSPRVYVPKRMESKWRRLGAVMALLFCCAVVVTVVVAEPWPGPGFTNEREKETPEIPIIEKREPLTQTPDPSLKIPDPTDDKKKQPKGEMKVKRNDPDIIDVDPRYLPATEPGARPKEMPGINLTTKPEDKIGRPVESPLGRPDGNGKGRKGEPEKPRPALEHLNRELLERCRQECADRMRTLQNYCEKQKLDKYEGKDFAYSHKNGQVKLVYGGVTYTIHGPEGLAIHPLPKDDETLKSVVSFFKKAIDDIFQK